MCRNVHISISESWFVGELECRRVGYRRVELSARLGCRWVVQLPQTCPSSTFLRLSTPCPTNTFNKTRPLWYIWQDQGMDFFVFTRMIPTNCTGWCTVTLPTSTVRCTTDLCFSCYISTTLPTASPLRSACLPMTVSFTDKSRHIITESHYRRASTSCITGLVAGRWPSIATNVTPWPSLVNVKDRPCSTSLVTNICLQLNHLLILVIPSPVTSAGVSMSTIYLPKEFWILFHKIFSTVHLKSKP